MDDEKRPDPEGIDEGPIELDEPVETMSMKNSFGTAVGAAMLGFEQALRNDPPAENLAAEHVPERGQTGDDAGDLVIEFPEPLDRKPDQD